MLIINDNFLSKLPDELASCDSLVHLNVANNQLTVLPSNIGHLKQLKSINLMGNYLIYLPLSLGLIDSLDSIQLSAFQTGMGKPKLSQVEYSNVGIVLTSPLLEQNYQPTAQKALHKMNKIQFNVKNPEEENSKEQAETSQSHKEHSHINRIPTPTQKERRKLEKTARTINAGQQKKNDATKPFEIKEARVSTLSGSSPIATSYIQTPRQRRSIDPEYIELTSDFRPLSRPSEPPSYNYSLKYSKMSQEELESFQNLSGIKDNQMSAGSPLLSEQC